MKKIFKKIVNVIGISLGILALLLLMSWTQKRDTEGARRDAVALYNQAYGGPQKADK